MTSPANGTNNVPLVNEPDKTDWPIAGTRVSPDDMRRIDLARVHGGYQNRSELIYAAVMERVEAILGQAGSP